MYFLTKRSVYSFLKKNMQNQRLGINPNNFNNLSKFINMIDSFKEIIVSEELRDHCKNPFARY